MKRVCYSALLMALPALLRPFPAMAAEAIAPVLDAPAVHASRQALLDRYFHEIRDLDFNWGSEGTVLEALAAIHLRDRYPPERYTIYNSVGYQDISGANRGELDIVVLNRETGQVEAVAEVKMSRNLEGGFYKAAGQLYRFKRIRKQHKLLRLLPRHPRPHPLTPEAFPEGLHYLLIGNTGAKAAGFDIEIDLTREEGAALYRAVLEYRKNKRKVDAKKTAPGTPAPIR